MHEHPRNRRPLEAFAIVAIAAVLSFIAWSFLNREYQPDGEEISAMGGQWIVDRPVWTNFDGMWRVDANVYPHRVRLSGVKVLDLAMSLCGSIAIRLPEAPVGENLKRDDIYRISVTAFYRKEKGEYLPASQYPIPITVVDGQCVSDVDWGRIYPRYPNELIHWRIEKAELQKDGKTAEFQFEWAPLVGGVEAQDFSFEKACNAVLNDPVARFPNLETGEDFDPEAYDKFEAILIKQRTSGGDYFVLEFGTYRTFEFKVAGNLCVSGRELDV